MMDPLRPYPDDFEGTRNAKRQRTFHHEPQSGGFLAENAHRDSFANEDYTVAWICALPLELQASRAMLDNEHRPLPSQPLDNNTYVVGRIDQHNVVMVCLPGEYGTNNAAIVSTNLKRSFPNIRATVMVGIGGGSPSMADVRLGDIVVGSRVMQYDMGKDVAGDEFLRTAAARIPSPLLLGSVSVLRSKHGRESSSARVTDLMQDRTPGNARPIQSDKLFKSSYQHPYGAANCNTCDRIGLLQRGPRRSTKSLIHYGVIGSGNTVMRDGVKRDSIAKQFSILCFEMEAAGMMDNLQCLPIRGICDYSDSHKNKEWQDYAAAAAAAYARELLEVLPPLHFSHAPVHPPRALGAPVTSHTSFPNCADIEQPNDTPDERRKRLLDSLDFLKRDERKTLIRAVLAKTCRWMLQHQKYQNWLRRELLPEHHGFFWIRGKAGAGKSTMMKFLYLEAKRKNTRAHTAIASFFFNAQGDYLEGSIEGMYRSLLLQLLEKFVDLHVVLDDTDIVPRYLQGCPDLNVLKELLREAILRLDQRTLTCFIDALDECDEQQVRSMVQYFEDLADATSTEGIQLRICFASRPYPYIDIRRGYLVTLEDESGHKEDLAQYVQHSLRVKNTSLLEELQYRILEKAAGIFMWIVVVVDILNEECSYGALALYKRLSEIPPELNDLFRSILSRDKNRPELLLLSLLWILCARRPLTLVEYYHALWTGLLEQNMADSEMPNNRDHNDCLRLVTSSSKGLAETTKSDPPTVQFIHESVRDFLVKEKGLQDLWPDIGFDWEAPSHERLKRCCVIYLQRIKVLKPPKVVASKPETHESDTKQIPFLEYAGQNILYHANAAALSIPQADFLDKFFDWGGLKILNDTEKFKIRQHDPLTSRPYIYADRGLENLIRTQEGEATGLSGLERCSGHYKYPLFAALANGHKGAVAALLGVFSTVYDGVDITEGCGYKKDFNKWLQMGSVSPLTWAAQEGKIGLLKLIINASGLGTSQESRLFSIACNNGQAEVVKFLLDYQVYPSDFFLHQLATICRVFDKERPNSALIEFFLMEKLEFLPECLGPVKDMLPLLLAKTTLSLVCVKHLIDNGADVNAWDYRGATALSYVIAKDPPDKTLAGFLIDRGADVNAQDYRGVTALSHALSKDPPDQFFAKFLIEKGAQPLCYS